MSNSFVWKAPFESFRVCMYPRDMFSIFPLTQYSQQTQKQYINTTRSDHKQSTTHTHTHTHTCTHRQSLTRTHISTPPMSNHSTRTNANWLKSRFHLNFAEYHGGKNQYGVMRVMNDDLVQPHRGFGTHPHSNMEIVTYVPPPQHIHMCSRT